MVSARHQAQSDASKLDLWTHVDVLVHWDGVRELPCLRVGAELVSHTYEVVFWADDSQLGVDSAIFLPSSTWTGPHQHFLHGNGYYQNVP